MSFGSGTAKPTMLPSENVDTFPAVVMRPIESLARLVNHSAPSGPVTMPWGLWRFRVLKVVTIPSGAIRPMELSLLVNHSAPSGPSVMP